MLNAGLILLIISLFWQCNNETVNKAQIVDVNGNKVIVCNVSEVKDSIDFPLSEIIDKCEMIPLETKKESMFQSIYHIGISENYIAIHSRGKMPIKLFNRQGKFIRDIGKIGKGPGEFTGLYGIQLDEPANRIYLTPFANASQIISYDLDGELQESIPLVYKQTKCQVYIEGDVVTVLSMPFNNEIPPAYQQTIDGELIQEHPILDHHIIRPDFSSEISSSNNSGAYDSYVMQYGGESFDTLYHYNTKINKLVPQFVLSFTGEKLGSWTRELSRHYWAPIFGENYRNKKVIVDKNTLEANFFNLVNDFYGGIEIKSFYTSNNGMFIGSIHAIDIIEEAELLLEKEDISSEDKEKLESILKKVDENDNEILFIGKMK